MLFIVAKIDTAQMHDIHVSGDNYVSEGCMEAWRQSASGSETDFDYKSQTLDDLVGLSECCGDMNARVEAINRIMYGTFGLRAIKLISDATIIQDHGRINTDLAAISQKLSELGIGYISEKTWLIGSHAQYRMLVKEFMDHVLSIRVSEQTWKFMRSVLSGAMNFDYSVDYVDENNTE